ncbi:MAG: bifunctional hydroxymethylpyrimidine kinase/phosphomethylpyrimidine kinase [Nitrospinota bacterium]
MDKSFLVTIGGFDPTSSAGVTLDLKIFKSFGLYGLAVITAVTAQNPAKFYATSELPPTFIKQEFDAISRYSSSFCKTGMLHSLPIVEEVANQLLGIDNLTFVLDPVIKSSSGATLLDPQALELLKSDLIPIATLITPNSFEATLLTGVKIVDIDSMKLAADKLMQFGAKNILITGGDLYFEKDIVELLVIEQQFHILKKRRLDIGSFHGTGCGLSATILSLLANSDSKKISCELVIKASSYISNILEESQTPDQSLMLLNI